MIWRVTWKRSLCVMLAALLRFISITIASSIDPSLSAGAASRLGVPAALLDAPPPHWRSSTVNLRRHLTGQGFHRSLHMNLQLDGLIGGAAECRLALLQLLPSGLFADPYQLDDLQRNAPGASFTLLGPLDLEL